MMHCNKIRLATVFSGIGAVEFAFKRMNIPCEIIFACDNGERDIEYDVDYQLDHYREYYICSNCGYVEEITRTNTKELNRKVSGIHTAEVASDVYRKK